MIRFALSTALMFSAGTALACSPPVPSCQVSGNQIATLYDTANGNIMFSQYDRTATPFTQTFVVVDCKTRSAVALGDDPDNWEPHKKARLAMQDTLRAGASPRLGKLHRDLKRLGMRSKRFKLRAAHCGCDLPTMPPPPANCPQDLEPAS